MTSRTTYRYNLRRIMRNAWFICRRVKKGFAAALRKAWYNEKRRVLFASIEGRNLAEEDAREEAARLAPSYTPATVPADYYGDPNRYYGD